jgi:hypothetical protein
MCYLISVLIKSLKQELNSSMTSCDNLGRVVNKYVANSLELEKVSICKRLPFVRLWKKLVFLRTGISMFENSETGR